jgi:hypothetical protein
MPDGHDVLSGANVLLSGEPTRLLVVPDVLALRISADVNPGTYPLAVPASAVVLAVEVVSPSSTTHDRFIKPALYAEAGIPSYWRVEHGTDGRPSTCTRWLSMPAVSATPAPTSSAPGRPRRSTYRGR